MNPLKQLVRSVFNRAGYEIVRTNLAPSGRNHLDDMKAFVKSERPLAFDIGANIGQTIGDFSSHFPGCTIHSFEPSPSTFAELKQKAVKGDNVHLWNCAMGATPGTLTLLENSSSTMSSFLPLGSAGWGTITKQTPVEVKTVDQFCKDQNIARIDILKSDTQGFDLEVLKGAEQMMLANKIGLIYLEVMFSDMYKGLPSFPEIFNFLTQRGYVLVSFYELHYRDRLLGWTDALFVHGSLLPSK